MYLSFGLGLWRETFRFGKLSGAPLAQASLPKGSVWSGRPALFLLRRETLLPRAADVRLDAAP